MFNAIFKRTFQAIAGWAMLLIVVVLLSFWSDQVARFVNLPGLLLVFGGTIAATMICRPPREVIGVIKKIPRLLSDDRPDAGDTIHHLLRSADLYRHGDIRAVERELETMRHPLLRSGIQMILDRSHVNDIRKALHWQIAGMHHRNSGDVQILRSMATFAPAFGMLGTLFGLVHMLHGLGNSSLGDIGVAMGFAMITTVYGIVAANLLLKPLAIKMERQVQQKLVQLKMLEEGVLMFNERRHPLMIKETLDHFLLHHQGPTPASTRNSALKAA